MLHTLNTLVKNEWYDPNNSIEVKNYINIYIVFTHEFKFTILLFL